MKTIKILATLGILAFTSASCVKEWLNVMPKNMQPADTMFDTYQGYQDALIGCYTKMKSRNLWGQNLTITTVEYLAQHWQKGNSNLAFITEETMNQFKNFNYDDVTVKAAFASIWSGLYNIIVQANSILEAIPLTAETAIPNPAARGVVEGEALAIRAMCHFEVLRLFGQFPTNNTSATLLGVPLTATQNVTLPYSKVVSRQPTSFYDYEAFIELLEKDLERAAELLLENDPFTVFTASQINSGNTNVSDDFLRSRQLRLNYYAVKALQARFYLYIGKNEEAYRAAMEVIEAASPTKGFSLSSNESNIRDRYYALPGEGLFMLSNHQLDDYWATIFPRTGSNLYMSAERIEGDMFGEPWEGTSNNRLRQLWLRRTASDLGGAVIYKPLKYNLEDSTRVIGGINLIRYKQVMPMLRLSEMYLIAMETGTTVQANALFREYRIARDVHPFDFSSRREILQEIEAEYRREFFAEGQMFAFYKRFRKSSMIWRVPLPNETAIRPMVEANYIVPLPDTEFISNNE